MNDFTIKEIDGIELSQPMPFKYIPAKDKTFMFQAHDGTEFGTNLEGIPITFENDFWMCAYQTTQEFWAAVIRANDMKELDPYPSYFKGKTRPVEQVSWDDIQVFNNILNKLFKEQSIKFEEQIIQDGNFALPSETQWEYAADAGQSLVFSGSQNLHDVGWFIENSNNQTMPVGLKQPNAWGLYDMSGNLLEWCTDDFKAYNPAIPKNGEPYLNKSNLKALRGGAFFDMIKDSRITYRFSGNSEIQGDSGGFRLVFSSELQLKHLVNQ